MPFPSLPDTGAEKGKNIFDGSVSFCWTPNASPTEEPDIPNHATAFPTAWILQSGNSDPSLPGTAIPAGAAAGKGDPSALTLLGDHAREFCFQGLLPWTLVWVTWSFSSSVICSVPIQSPPLHIDASAHLNICTFDVAKRVFPLKNASLESDSYDSSDTFKRTFVPLLWLRKIYFSLFLQLRVLLPDLNQPAEKESSGQDLQHHPIQWWPQWKRKIRFIWNSLANLFRLPTLEFAAQSVCLNPFQPPP